MAQRLLNHRAFGLLVIALIIAVAPLFFPSTFYYRMGTAIFIAALAAVGLNVLMGLAGQVSLGHAGFYGIGAYAVAVGPATFDIAPWAAIFIGIALAAAVAYLVGRPILKLRGHYLAVATLGFGILVSMVLTNEGTWTGGPDGMGVKRLVLFGYVLKDRAAWYWASAAVLLVGAVVAVNLIESPTGRALRALHDSEVAAAVNGIDVARYKLVAFVISACYASLAGSLAALSDAFITPASAGFLKSIELVTMVVLGGMGSVIGSIIGAAFLESLPQLLARMQEIEHVLLGLIIMLVMIFMRDGLFPTLARRFRRAAP
ncbi:MAG: branched-chain amino acid ABC transporter permease [Hyphomicrobiales bacterium]|nr:MAG: branched-chain amino acid ABC transporter permease [Hyphomicrobiales bacterium]